MFENFDEKELHSLILNKTEESLHLDYKKAAALDKNPNIKFNISKDVSAFANSNGGTIIYGITEKNHLPEAIDPIKRENISREWLDQVISTNIQPRILGVVITPIPIGTTDEEVVYVVNIPKSYTAHQASDKKYYKRHNTTSLAMDDYEIRDIINRQQNPLLKLTLVDSSSLKYDNDVLVIPFVIENTSLKMAKDTKFTVRVGESQDYEIVQTDLTNLSSFNLGKNVFGSSSDFIVYKGLSHRVGYISVRFLNGLTKLSFTISIHSDMMEPVTGSFEVQIYEGNIQYNITG